MPWGTSGGAPATSPAAGVARITVLPYINLRPGKGKSNGRRGALTRNRTGAGLAHARQWQQLVDRRRRGEAGGLPERRGPGVSGRPWRRAGTRTAAGRLKRRIPAPISSLVVSYER